MPQASHCAKCSIYNATIVTPFTDEQQPGWFRNCPRSQHGRRLGKALSDTTFSETFPTPVPFRFLSSRIPLTSPPPRPSSLSSVLPGALPRVSEHSLGSAFCKDYDHLTYHLRWGASHSGRDWSASSLAQGSGRSNPWRLLLN